MNAPTKIDAPLLSARNAAAGDGWVVQDVICRSGPEDGSFEERHQSIAVAMVMGGTFQYRSSVGRAVLTPGAVMLGAPGVCFECGHEHGLGDRCLAFHYRPDLWEDIVAAIPGVKRTAVTLPQLPPLETLAPLFAEAETARDEEDVPALEELAWRIAGVVAGTLADAPRRARTPSSRDIQRVTAIVRRIETEPEVEQSLARLAGDAAMSPYHFLRTFRQVVGMAPHQYVLRTRMHRAAVRLRRSREEIAVIAFGAGFNDLSTFNRRFKKVMGVSPSLYRASRRKNQVGQVL
jgi:AraC family transcriptional regulator